MSDREQPTGMRHLAGLGLTLLAAAAIVFAWRSGLGWLNGTAFEELRYIVFAVFVAGLLTGLHALISRILR